MTVIYGEACQQMLINRNVDLAGCHKLHQSSLTWLNESRATPFSTKNCLVSATIWVSPRAIRTPRLPLASWNQTISSWNRAFDRFKWHFASISMFEITVMRLGWSMWRNDRNIIQKQRPCLVRKKKNPLWNYFGQLLVTQLLLILRWQLPLGFVYQHKTAHISPHIIANDSKSVYLYN